MRAHHLICGLLGPVCASAAAEEPPPVQVAVYGGYRAGGNLEDPDTGADRDLDDGAALAVSFELRAGRHDDRFVQLWYSRQGSSVDDGLSSNDVDVEVLHLGGTIPIGDHERIRPYFAAGLGATRFSPSGPAAGDRTRFSGSLAVGFAVPAAGRAEFRLELRGYVTAIDADSAIFCRSDDGSAFCRIVASGSPLIQVEGLAGFAVRF